MPVACEDVLREEADTAGADTHGRWDEAVDVFPVQEVVLKLLFRDAVGGCVVELSQQPDFTDIGLLGTLSLATELKRSDHVLTQWGHEMSPFMRRVVCVRRKTSETDWGREGGLLTAASAAYLNKGLQPTASSGG